MKLREMIEAAAGDCASVDDVRADGRRGCFLCGLIWKQMSEGYLLRPQMPGADGTFAFPVRAQLDHILAELRDAIPEDWDDFVETNL